MDEHLRYSPLHQCHLAADARMVPFAGWQLPVQYEGIIPENRAVRSSLGIFDISHMGQLVVAGSEAESLTAWLDTMLTNSVSALQAGQGQYTLLLNDSGGVIDDLIIYNRGGNEYFLVVNASRTEQDFTWLQQHLPADGIRLTNASEQFAGIAVQGPDSVRAFHTLFGENTAIPERFCMTELATQHGQVIVCRTGYTGEDGFELFCEADLGPHWWQACLDAGAIPCGLGARDSLRLEKCYPLNGNDLSAEQTPLEAGLSFAVDLTKPEFIGRSRLVQQKSAGLSQRLVALKQLGKSPPPRSGYDVFSEEQRVGTLTSGGVSPSLGCGISMAYIDSGFNGVGTHLDVEIRGRRFPAEVVKKPFL